MCSLKRSEPSVWKPQVCSYGVSRVVPGSHSKVTREDVEDVCRCIDVRNLQQSSSQTTFHCQLLDLIDSFDRAEQLLGSRAV